MRVGEVARRTGVGTSTLRAWERRFGLLEPQRSTGGQRIYEEADVERVAAVRRLVDEGLSLPAAVARVRSAGPAAVPTGEGESLFFAQILQATSVAVWVGNRKGRTRYANRKMAELLGCSLDDLLSRSGYDFIQPSELTSTRQRANTLRLGARLHFEAELQRDDGSTFIAEVRTNPIQDRAGKYEGSVAIVTDITARKEAERDALFRAALLDAVGEGVVAANVDTTIAYVNEAAARMFGWSVAETIGVSGFDIPAAAEARDKVVEMYERVSTGETATADLPLVRVDGSRFVGHVTAAPVYSTGGELAGLIAVVRDMTERMELDEALRTHGLRGSAVAVLGARAIAEATDMAGADDAVLNESIEATRRLLGADRAAILEVTSDASLTVRAASPARESAVVAGGSRSLAGYTMLARGVVTVEDTETERRFDPGSLAPETRSAMAAPVYGPVGVRAVLVAERPTPGPFDRGSADFLQALANVVGAALAARS